MIPLTDERLRQLAYDDMVCTNANERAMAAELLSARARIAELEADQARLVEDVASTVRRCSVTLDERDTLRAQVAELEAAQRPPDAFIVMSKHPELGYFPIEMDGDRTAAVQRLRWHDPDGTAIRSDGLRFAFGEVREVQP